MWFKQKAAVIDVRAHLSQNTQIIYEASGKPPVEHVWQSSPSEESNCLDKTKNPIAFIQKSQVHKPFILEVSTVEKNFGSVILYYNFLESFRQSTLTAWLNS